MNPENLTLTQAAESIRSVKLSPVDYLQGLLTHIDKVEPGIRAWVTLDSERAMAEARRCEAEARAGAFRGPLHGVPIGIKDISRLPDSAPPRDPNSFRTTSPRATPFP